jgi:hypothetical protein
MKLIWDIDCNKRGSSEKIFKQNNVTIYFMFGLINQAADISSFLFSN